MSEKKPLPEAICDVAFWYDRELEKIADDPPTSQRRQGLRIALCFALADIYNEIKREIIENKNQ